MCLSIQTVKLIIVKFYIPIVFFPLCETSFTSVQNIKTSGKITLEASNFDILSITLVHLYQTLTQIICLPDQSHIRQCFCFSRFSSYMYTRLLGFCLFDYGLDLT
jgi:hypothetical protein